MAKRQIAVLGLMAALMLAAPAAARPLAGTAAGGTSIDLTGPDLLDREEQRLLGRWQITAIAGHPAVMGSRAGLHLDGLRLTGSTGCNYLGGNYRVERGYLTTGGVIATRRACTGALARQEAALLAMLEQRLAVRQSPRGRIILTGRDGKTLVLVRAVAG